MAVTARDLLDLARGTIRDTCPVCGHLHAVTTRGRLWTHGPRGGRCHGSRQTIRAALAAAADRRARGQRL